MTGRYLDIQDPKTLEFIGKQIAREFWRGFRLGMIAALVVVVLLVVATGSLDR